MATRRCELTTCLIALILFIGACVGDSADMPLDDEMPEDGTTGDTL